MMNLLVSHYSPEGENIRQVVQWLGHLKTKGSSSHYLDGLTGCGLAIEEKIRSEFYEILSYIIDQLQETTDKSIALSILTGLQWAYKSA